MPNSPLSLYLATSQHHQKPFILKSGSAYKYFMQNNSHSKTIDTFLDFGFMGAHRFYFGRPISGTIYFFSFGLLGVGWLVDLFLIPSMDRDADRRYIEGRIDYNLCWLLLAFLGLFGVHRFYMGKVLSGLLWLFTGGLFFIGYLYDLWTLNEQVDDINRFGTKTAL
ncbi:MAG: NINE protein [Bdellovibrionales bacterium]